MAADAAAKLDFEAGQKIVYPAHGVGTVTSVDQQQVAGMTLEVYVVSFDQDKMILRVPTNRAIAAGMRALAGSKLVDDALRTLGGKARIKRTMWSRRAQEYEAKINSGEIVLIAEVTRDLFRPEDQPEQSYSERQIFEAASSRLARELGAMEETDEATALEKILEVLREHAPQYYDNDDDDS